MTVIPVRVEHGEAALVLLIDEMHPGRHTGDLVAPGFGAGDFGGGGEPEHAQIRGIGLETGAPIENAGVFPTRFAVIASEAIKLVIRQGKAHVRHLRMQSFLHPHHIGIHASHGGNETMQPIRPRAPSLVIVALVADVVADKGQFPLRCPCRGQQDQGEHDAAKKPGHGISLFS